MPAPPQRAQQVDLRIEVHGCRAELVADLGREGLHPSRLPPRRRTRAELLLEHGLVHRAIPRQPGGLQLDADEGARRLRGEQQAQRARVGARGDERELAGEFLRRPRRAGGAWRVDRPTPVRDRRRSPRRAGSTDRPMPSGDADLVEVVEVEERAVRPGRTRRLGPGTAAAAAVGRAGRQPRRSRVMRRTRARPSVEVDRSRIAPHSRRSWHRSTRTPGLEQSRVPSSRLDPDPSRMLAHLELADRVGQRVGRRRRRSGVGGRVGVDEGDAVPLPRPDHDLHASILAGADDSVGGHASPWTHG